MLDHRAPPTSHRRAAHPAGPAPAARSELAELGRLLLRTVVPTGVVLGVVLGVYGGTGHDLTIILQDRFPEDSEYSGLLTIVFSSALLVCAGIALGALVTTRAWFRSAASAGHPPPAAVTAGLALSIFAIVIAFDDVMMVHDSILPGAGIPEDVGLAAYAVVGVVLVARALGPLRREGLALAFLGCLALLAGSLGGDVLESLLEGPYPALGVVVGHAEDVVKFLAYAGLCHLCVLLARRVFARTLQSATERAAREAVERARAPAPSLVTLRATPATASAVPPESAGELTAPL